MSSERTARIEENPEGGRDFVVVGAHGEFPTLEALLEHIEFDASTDRLFGLGDLVGRRHCSASLAVTGQGQVRHLAHPTPCTTPHTYRSSCFNRSLRYSP